MRSVATRVLAEQSAGQPGPSGAEVPARAGVPARRERSKPSRGLWIEPARFLELLDALSLATWACATAARLRPALSPPRHPGGAPRTYSDETILVTLLVRRAWCRSLEGMADWLARDTALAAALGYPPGGPTISAAQLSRGAGGSSGCWCTCWSVSRWSASWSASVSSVEPSSCWMPHSYRPGHAATATPPWLAGVAGGRPSATRCTPSSIAPPTCPCWCWSPRPPSTR